MNTWPSIFCVGGAIVVILSVLAVVVACAVLRISGIVSQTEEGDE